MLFRSNIKKTIGDWATDIGKFLDGVVKFFQDLPNKIATFINDLISKFKTWGANLASAFINAFTDAFKGAGTLITGALNVIGKFLEGHSPPSEGPFKDIDKWGANVGSAWVTGFSSAIASMPAMNFGGMSGGGFGGGSQNYNTQNNQRTSSVAMTNYFNVKNEASADNVAQYLGFLLEHKGVI